MDFVYYKNEMKSSYINKELSQINYLIFYFKIKKTMKKTNLKTKIIRKITKIKEMNEAENEKSFKSNMLVL